MPDVTAFPVVEVDEDCGCEPDVPEDDGYPPTHFLRTCERCGCIWEGLHCPHDGYQNRCPDCNLRPTPPGRNYRYWNGPPMPKTEANRRGLR
jgi:hypothetical protein